MGLFEFEDLDWFPASVRNAGTDIIRYAWERRRAWQPVVLTLRRVLEATGEREILDLGSGGGGPIVPVTRELRSAGYDIRVTLSDKFPNLPAFEYAALRGGGAIRFEIRSVDATAAPRDLAGLRTMFAALHHFPPDVVREMLSDAVESRRPVAMFDLTPKTPPPLPMLLLGNPIGVLLITPFIRPFRLSRLLWTYLIPVVPIYLTWDALVSGARLYSVDQLRAIVDGLPPNDYVWEIDSEPYPVSITHLVGYPPQQEPATHLGSPDSSP
jgi:hypothetical protein